MNFQWDKESLKWTGKCPRCGMASFFEPRASTNYANSGVDTLVCPAKHLFSVEYHHPHRELFRDIFPKEFTEPAPSWLPPEYNNCFDELQKAVTTKSYRSIVALCGIMLEAHVNTLLNTEGDKGKSLYERLSILKTKGRIDQDQFSDATIARLTRKEVLHPEQVTAEVPPEEAQEVQRTVMSFLEREFKFRSSKALPSGEREV